MRSSNGDDINLGDMLAECVAARVASKGVAINGVQCACARSLVRQKQVMRPFNLGLPAVRVCGEPRE